MVVLAECHGLQHAEGPFGAAVDLKLGHSGAAERVRAALERIAALRGIDTSPGGMPRTRKGLPNSSGAGGSGPPPASRLRPCTTDSHFGRGARRRFSDPGLPHAHKPAACGAEGAAGQQEATAAGGAPASDRPGSSQRPSSHLATPPRRAGPGYAQLAASPSRAPRSPLAVPVATTPRASRRALAMQLPRQGAAADKAPVRQVVASQPARVVRHTPRRAAAAAAAAAPLTAATSHNWRCCKVQPLSLHPHSAASQNTGSVAAGAVAAAVPIAAAAAAAAAAWGHSLSCHVEMNHGQGNAFSALLFRMLKMMLKAYLQQ
jgi:hypothetical protein